MSAVLSVFALECAASGAIRVSNIGPIYDQRDPFSLHGYHGPKTLCTDHTLIPQ